ncbi:MAG TPA: thioredoxin family protein [Sumerlaeia bacterium]|nr:thioredoxin family protein [Sumerlaeia bacterium]
MMRKLLRRTVVCAAALAAMLFTPVAGAEREGWMTDYDAAKKKAAEEGKDMLVDFSGSDWNEWCQRLDKEVFSQEGFREKTSKDFVLVLLDFPKEEGNIAKIPETQRKRNDELAAEFGIPGFPTVYLTDSQGAPYALTGYRRGGPESYLKDLADFRTKKVRKDQLLARAKDAQITGMDRAKLLDEIIQTAQEEIAVKCHKKEMEEIVELDKDGKGGLRGKYELKLRTAEAERAMEARDFATADKVYQGILDDLKPTSGSLQNILYAKSAALFFQGDKASAEKHLREALKAAPNGERAKFIQTTLDQVFSVEEKKPDVETKPDAAGGKPATESKPAVDNEPAAASGPADAAKPAAVNKPAEEKR